ncbi:hypothetical protein BRD16_07465 [Halobacteriales archaeon SW_6_65_46]|nr:MAG: hypothetical protein BRD16_07465 [Halobacteriales archaeon SW_6_65_46]
MHNRWLRLAEFAVWTAGATVAVVATAAVPSLLFGSGLLTLKYVLFVVGVLLFGLGSFAIQPESPAQLRPEQSPSDRGATTRIPRPRQFSTEGTDEFGVEARLEELPPMRGRLPFDDRVGRDAKLFVTSLLVLAVSAALEFVVGV